MKTVTTNPMTKTTITILTTLLCLANAGCSTDQPANQDQVEIVSPTGCLKSQGRYYDPKVKDCVQVDNQHQARVLDAYRYVNKLAEEGKLEEVEYDITLKEYSTIEKTEELWAELHEEGANMLILSGMLPTGRHYDDPLGKAANYEGPKVWGGPDVAMGCGWDYRSDTPASTIQEMILRGVEDLETNEVAYGGARSRPELREAIFEDDDCRIRTMMVKASPTVMRDFWDHHLDDIEGIQPRITTLDFAQPALGPVHLLTEEK